MADDRTPADDETPQEPTAGEEQPTEESPAEPEAAEEQAGADAPAAAEERAGDEEPAADEPAAPDRQAVEAAAAQEPVAEAIAAAEEGDGAEQPAAEQPPAAAEGAEQPAAEQPAPAPAAAEGAEQPAAAAAASADDEGDEDEEEPTPRVKPEIPGADLEVDIVTEGTDPFGRGESAYDEDEEPEPAAEETDDVPDDQPIAAVTIDLAAGARYRATGKRKTAVARVTLRPGDGSYLINGRTLDEFFPRGTLQRNIRQPLEAVGYETRMDVVARMHGGGVSAQAGALRHGISRALLEADPNLRGELKRRGFLTRDPRVKERKKAGLKKARKRPQFSKR
jgi:small subunit ribosomal protein S9